MYENQETIIKKIKVNVAIRNEKKNVRSVIASINKASIQLNIIAKNPEIIAPLNKLKNLIGGQTVQVQGVISGEDIFLSNDRYSRRKNSY